MKRLISQSFVAVAFSSCVIAANASINVHSVLPEEVTIKYTLPSGSEETYSLSGVGSVMGSRNLPTDRNVLKINVSIVNGAGETIAKATLQDDRNYTLMPSGGGFALVPTGNYSRGSGSIVPSIVIVNALPENYKVELQGMNGKHGIKDAKVSRSVDLNNANRIPPGEDRYKMVITAPDGTKFTDTDHAHVGSIMVIHKTYNGPIGATTAGYLVGK
jgi:hypothetical protein